MLSRRWIKWIDKIGSLKQIQLEQTEYLLHRIPLLRLEFQKGEPEKSDLRDPDVGEHRIGGDTEKRLKFQVPLP